MTYWCITVNRPVLAVDNSIMPLIHAWQGADPQGVRLDGRPAGSATALDLTQSLVLDGLPLRNDAVRLFTVERSNRGKTVVRRVEVSEELLSMADKGIPLSSNGYGTFGGVPRTSDEAYLLRHGRPHGSDRHSGLLNNGGDEDFTVSHIQPPSSAYAEGLDSNLSEGWKGVLAWCSGRRMGQSWA